MTENKFIKKFRQKTESELKFILENKKNYNKQAVAAAISILNERKGVSVEIKSVENGTEIEQEKKRREKNKINGVKIITLESYFGSELLASVVLFIFLHLFYLLSKSL